MALAWILRDGHITSVLIGASKSSRILDNTGMLSNLKFDQTQRERLDRILGERGAVPKLPEKGFM